MWRMSRPSRVEGQCCFWQKNLSECDVLSARYKQPSKAGQHCLAANASGGCDGVNVLLVASGSFLETSPPSASRGWGHEHAAATAVRWRTFGYECLSRLGRADAQVAKGRGSTSGLLLEDEKSHSLVLEGVLTHPVMNTRAWAEQFGPFKRENELIESIEPVLLLLDHSARVRGTASAVSFWPWKPLIMGTLSTSLEWSQEETPVISSRPYLMNAPYQLDYSSPIPTHATWI